MEACKAFGVGELYYDLELNGSKVLVSDSIHNITKKDLLLLITPDLVRPESLPVEPIFPDKPFLIHRESAPVAAGHFEVRI